MKKNDTARAPTGGNGGEQRHGATDGCAMTAELPDGTVSRLLTRLDRMLRAAVERMLASLGPDAAADPFRGLYISRDDASRLLDPWPGGTAWSVHPPLADDLAEADRREDGSQNVGPELAWLADAYGLSDFDLHVVLLALAPEIDLRYERVYAFLQDDVSRRRPTVDLALNLVCTTPEDKLRRRWHFTDEAPLIRNDVVRLMPEPGNTEPPLLANALKLDERIVRRLFGYRSLDPLLRGICAIIERADSALEMPALGDRLEALVALGRQAEGTGEPLCLYMSGPPGWAKRQLAAAVASGVGMQPLPSRAVPASLNSRSPGAPGRPRSPLRAPWSPGKSRQSTYPSTKPASPSSRLSRPNSSPRQASGSGSATEEPSPPSHSAPQNAAAHTDHALRCSSLSLLPFFRFPAPSDRRVITRAQLVA